MGSAAKRASACVDQVAGLYEAELNAQDPLRAGRLVLGLHSRRLAASRTKETTLQNLFADSECARSVEKWAVLIGGGQNHRLGLSDMIMLKDNHIDMAGGISAAINRTKDYLRATGKKLPVEVETRSLKEVTEVLSAGGVDIIMLDNMELADMREAVRLIGGKCKTEASGGVTVDTIRAIAECGVDYISVGALTHAVKSLDLSLKTAMENNSQ